MGQLAALSLPPFPQQELLRHARVQMIPGQALVQPLGVRGIKGGINAVIAFLVYKPVVGALRKSGLVKERESGAKSRFGLVPTVIALAALATLVLLLLALAKVI